MLQRPELENAEEKRGDGRYKIFIIGNTEMPEVATLLELLKS